jgi:hypothetical protein
MAQKPRDRERTSKNETLKLGSQKSYEADPSRRRCKQGCTTSASENSKLSVRRRTDVGESDVGGTGRKGETAKGLGQSISEAVSVQLNQSLKSSVPRSSNFSES